MGNAHSVLVCAVLVACGSVEGEGVCVVCGVRGVGVVIHIAIPDMKSVNGFQITSLSHHKLSLPNQS